MHAGNFSHALDDVFQMLQIFDFHDDVDVGLAVLGASADAADISFEIADDRSDLL